MCEDEDELLSKKVVKNRLKEAFEEIEEGAGVDP